MKTGICGINDGVIGCPRASGIYNYQIIGMNPGTVKYMKTPIGSINRNTIIYKNLSRRAVSEAETKLTSSIFTTIKGNLVSTGYTIGSESCPSVTT